MLTVRDPMYSPKPVSCVMPNLLLIRRIAQCTVRKPAGAAGHRLLDICWIVPILRGRNGGHA